MLHKSPGVLNTGVPVFAGWMDGAACDADYYN
jgi:hypothetical protein